MQKYSGSDGRKPRINKLGGTEWQKTRTRVSHAVGDMAKELIELYAKRFFRDRLPLRQGYGMAEGV